MCKLSPLHLYVILSVGGDSDTMKKSFLLYHMSWDSDKSDTVSPITLRGAFIK